MAQIQFIRARAARLCPLSKISYTPRICQQHEEQICQQCEDKDDVPASLPQVAAIDFRSIGGAEHEEEERICQGAPHHLQLALPLLAHHQQDSPCDSDGPPGPTPSGCDSDFAPDPSLSAAA